MLLRKWRGGILTSSRLHRTFRFLFRTPLLSAPHLLLNYSLPSLCPLLQHECPELAAVSNRDRNRTFPATFGISQTRPCSCPQTNKLILVISNFSNGPEFGLQAIEGRHEFRFRLYENNKSRSRSLWPLARNLPARKRVARNLPARQRVNQRSIR